MNEQRVYLQPISDNRLPDTGLPGFQPTPRVPVERLIIKGHGVPLVALRQGRIEFQPALIRSDCFAKLRNIHGQINLHLISYCVAQTYPGLTGSGVEFDCFTSEL